MTPGSTSTVERRPSRAAAVVAAVVAAVGVALVVGSLEGGDDTDTVLPPDPVPTVAPTTVEPRPLLPGETADLVVAGDGRLVRVNLATGVVTDLPLADRQGGIVQPPLTVNGTVVVVQRFVAWSIDVLGRRPPLELGPADAVAPADARFVWLVDLRADEARRVSVDGRPSPDYAIPLPPGTWRITPVTGRFVLSSQSRWLLLDADGRVAREQEGRVIASGGELVVWLPQPCRAGPCEVRITHLRGGIDRAFRLDAMPAVSIHEARLTTTGGLILAGDLAGDRSAYEVLLVDVDDPTAPPRALATGLPSAPLVIAEDDGSVFWTTRRFASTETDLTAYRLDTGEMRRVELPVDDISTFSAL